MSNPAKTIRCIAVDDEPLALEQIRRFAGRIEGMEIVALCLSASRARAALMEHPEVELMLLDVEMPGESGLDLARSLHREHPGLHFIFLTAFPQYALHGYEVEALDYLLKPLSTQALERAVERVSRRIAAPAPSPIAFKSSGRTVLVDPADILYVKGLAEYVQIFRSSDPTPVTTLTSMKNLSELLAGVGRFVRTHRSYIVNMDRVTSYSPTLLQIGTVRIPVGETYREQVARCLF